MKLLIVSDSFLPRWDGVARFLYEIIPRISDSFDITVVAPMFKGRGTAFKNVDVIRVPLTRFKAGDYQVPKASLGIISKAISQSDVVWTNTLGPLCMNACLSSRVQNKPIVAYVHSIEWELFHLSIKKSKAVRRFVYSLTKIVARIHYNLIDLLIVPTEEVAEKLTFAGIKTNKTVVRLGVDTKRFKPAEDKRMAKESIGIPQDSFVVGYCGRLAREKDLPTLRRAFNRFKKKHKNAKLLIVGDGVKEIKESFMNIKEAIVVGSTNEVEKYYRAMDVFVLPSLTETTALTVLEAMAS
ncbi:MAG: 1,2-diacylglycerol 3-alpha-glucosyltransferase, partial [Candidatus Woesearchaeota archaeon]|nr:1,2-diacylglycerol 3-alpha-glucosyltransferase [Candidatus Woesearchaeota archaeon]